MASNAAIVDAATWTAALVAGYLAVRGIAAALRVGRVAAKAAVGVGLATALVGGGAAFAGSGGGASGPPAVSADWPTGKRAAEVPAVTVRPGDCLWDIAAHRLAHPTSARVAAAWPRWWLANRVLIGVDPDLVRPGQRLRPPSSTRSPS
jgi:nucleoid-associated protein YgaU